MRNQSDREKEGKIQGRVSILRQKMREKGIQWYLIPTADFHNSEYVNDYFKVREYFSGFTGSNGTLLVSDNMAGLWTDGRYFIQAEHELEGSNIILFRMMEEGVPTLQDYLKMHMQKGDILGVDGRVITASFGNGLESVLKEKGAKIIYEEDLAGAIWKERPELPQEQVFLLEENIAGMKIMEKLKKVRDNMEANKAEVFVLSKLDDIMWLYNMRGGDIPCNPVALAYTIIDKSSATLFIQDNVLKKEDTAFLNENQIQLETYDKFYTVLEKELKDKTVLLDEKNVNYMIEQFIKKNNKIVNQTNPTELQKAMKNEIEIKNLREIYLKDSAAVTKFIYWVKNIVKNEDITEYDAAMYLDELRREIPEFLDLSFETISAYQENAAMMHYTATKENAKLLKPTGTLLVDSGGQYKGGTTDVTRTICLGEISMMEKVHFTYTCIGMLNLLNARFLYGCTGRNLDILAREPLWRIDIDYKCGTGHGIGYMLNVHEGPQNIRWRYAKGSEEPAFEAGMVVSNEPGVYLEGEYGIRIENIMLCRKGNKNDNGQFMYFEPLTFVPIDRKAIDASLMSNADLERLNAYHHEVYEKISPYLTEEEKTWLKEETRPIL